MHNLSNYWVEGGETNSLHQEPFRRKRVITGPSRKNTDQGSGGPGSGLCSALLEGGAQRKATPLSGAWSPWLLEEAAGTDGPKDSSDSPSLEFLQAWTAKLTSRVSLVILNPASSPKHYFFLQGPAFPPLQTRVHTPEDLMAL